MKNLEIEAKYINIDPEKIGDKLRSLGFDLIYREFDVFRATLICRDPAMDLRVRKEYGKITMTYKYTNLERGALGTEEIEVEVENFEKAVAILIKAHNPKRVLYQESKRELWRKGETEVSIDEWPGTGKYVEIESPTEKELISTTESLGLDYADALFGRVGCVYAALGYNVDEINRIEHLTFENPPRK